MDLRRPPHRDRQSVVIALGGAAAAALAVAAVLLLGHGVGGKEAPAPVARSQEATAGDTPPPTAGPGPGSAEPSARPTAAPQVTGVTGRVFTADPRAVETAEPIPVPENYDGCDHNYGAVTQCVPWTFPDGITAVGDKCEWLRLNGFGNLTVAGEDRQGLDANRDDIACNS
ncbi:hypothetical protein [Actinocorallia longicatena]|uniref:Secreted protein n=1 Tax=Actinocorallia longicatena TaxID=111803 RepID=A0ABP6QKX0_9ACTN